MKPTTFFVAVTANLVFILLLGIFMPTQASAEPRNAVIPLCWNQTVPHAPIYHPAARCTGKIIRN